MKKAKARTEVRRSPRTKDVKVFYKESSSSDDTKKATIKAEAKIVAGRKFPSPDPERVRRSTTQKFSSDTATGLFPCPWPFVPPP